MHPCTGPVGGVEVLLYPFMTTAVEGGEGSASRPVRCLPPGKSQYPLYRRLGGPQVRSGQARKVSPPPGFDPRTVQPVASSYTDYATRPTPHESRESKFVVLYVHTPCRVSPSSMQILVLYFEIGHGRIALFGRIGNVGRLIKH